MDNYNQFREINDRSESVLPCNIYSLTGYMGGGVPLHWHDEIEIILPKTNGYALLNGECIYFDNNDIVICNTRTIHTTSFNKSGIVHHIVIDPAIYSMPHKHTHGENLIFPTIIKNADNKLISILDKIIEYGRPVPEEKEYEAVSFIYLFVSILKNSNMLSYQAHETSPQLEYVRMIMTYIGNNLTNKLTIDTLAKHVGLSKAYLMRLFKHSTGNTLIHYIHSEKINASKNDLKNGVPISDIAYQYGYSDTAHYCHTFKQYEGITPKEWKLTF